MKIAWFSCGVTSAVACKIALQKYDNVKLFYTDTGSQDEDSLRFLHDCEAWFSKKINIVKNEKYKDHFDVIEQTKYINSAHFATCSKCLKKDMRCAIEDKYPGYVGQVFGFDISEKSRAEYFSKEYPTSKPLYPLIHAQLSKPECMQIIINAGIKLPEMYKKGYKNNNCIGCVRGGMGYWNKIRIDYPDTFERMTKLERKIGHSCLNEFDGYKKQPLFLDELGPNRGDFPKEIMPECGLFCELEGMRLK
jgi:3'-phosphoadenosine 5'-phosphosulfate sulfotransferase (PAPS reductase)/FAD synthetase